MEKFLTLFLGMLFSFSSFAQMANVSGEVKDGNENKPIQNAVVALLTPKDSTLYSFTRTDSAGKYILKNISSGKYILMTSQPDYADVLNDIEVNGDTKIPSTNLVSKGELLKEVIIKSGSPLRIKGDTTVYTADSFKVSANANVEELLKKLPGIQVDKDGNIKAMGETVQKVLVDGEEFFGDDPGMAVKNIRADAVKEVQVFDKKSDEAEFTGIDDGKTQKTINLKLKANKKTGYFGKVDVTAGPENHIDNRYNDNLMFGSFKGKRKLSAFFLNGNTGQDQLNWQDEQKYGGNDNLSFDVDDDGGISVSYIGNDDQEPYVDPQNGYMTNVNAGVQYTNKWNDDKYNFNFSPKYNSQQYTDNKITFTQTQIGDSVLNANSNEIENVNRHNFKIRGILDTKIDSFNSVKVTAGTNFYHTESDDLNNTVTTGNNGVLKNASDVELKTRSDKSALSGNVIFKHKFHKARRTFSFTGNWYSLNNTGVSFLKSSNQAYFEGALSGSQDLNQEKNFELSTNNLSGSIVYTEPLNKTLSLLLGYQLSYNNGTNNQITYNYSGYSGKYDAPVDSLSNNFKQNIIQNIPSAKINFANKKLKVNVGSGFGFTHFDLKDVTFNKDYLRNYTNFYPSANAVYTYKPNHSIRFYYNGNTTQPTIDQLQPLRNNNNYFNQVIGNPDLKPSFTNSFRLGNQTYNFLKNLYVYESINVQLVQNAITTNSIVDLDSAKTISQPINVNGNYNIGFFGGIGFKIKKIDTRFDMSPNFNFSRYTSVINSQKGYAKTFTPGIWVNISKSKEKKYDLYISDGFNYNSNTTSQNDTKIEYFTNQISFNGTIYFKKVWSLITDYTYYFRQKTIQSNTNLNTNIWNAQFQRTFKHEEFTVYFKVNDILDQNIGIQRNFYGNTYTQETDERLKRYFMIGFTWNFKNK
ncbi:MAG TPA: outer membrane beta-barrel family protein [Hanamia sp.]|nr:outer membrane beta-barrel family protein [Hanamia sp.]